jgi:hypothetical protein
VDLENCKEIDESAFENCNEVEVICDAKLPIQCKRVKKMYFRDLNLVFDVVKIISELKKDYKLKNKKLRKIFK